MKDAFYTAFGERIVIAELDNKNLLFNYNKFKASYQIITQKLEVLQIKENLTLQQEELLDTYSRKEGELIETIESLEAEIKRRKLRE